MTTYRCPVCGFRGLAEPPWNGDSGSFEICPSCGVQFGYSDAAGGDLDRRLEAYRSLRARWIDGGMQWHFGAIESPPEAWDPAEQLRRLDDE